MAVPDINPLALIGKYTPTPIDYGPVQKLLTDAHIQQSKNKAAAAQNLLKQQVAFSNKLVDKDLDPGAEFLRRLRMNPPGLADALTKSRGLVDTKTEAEARKNMAQQLKLGREVGVEPHKRIGPLADIAGSSVRLTPNLPIKESVVTTNVNEQQGYKMPPPGSGYQGAVKVKEGSTQKTKGAAVGPQLNAEQAYLGGNTQKLSYGMQQSAKHLGMSMQEFNDFLEKGLANGSITFFIDPGDGTSGVVINGQEHTWL